MQEIAQLIIEDGGWQALLFVITLLIVYRIEGHKNTTAEILVRQTEVMGLTVAPMQSITTELKEIGTQNAQVSRYLAEFARLYWLHDARAQKIQGQAEVIQNTLNGVGLQVGAVPGDVFLIMAPKIDEIPAAVQKAIAPHIEGLQDEIAKLIQSLDEIPDKTTELIRKELLTLNQKIEEVLAVAKKISATDLKEGAEQAPAAPETNEVTQPEESKS